MRVRIMIEKDRKEPEAVIYAAEESEEVARAKRLLQEEMLNGYEENKVVRLPLSRILRFYGENQRVYAQTADGVFQIRQRLYELEERLDSREFLRISNSEIVSSDAILRLDISLSGTIGVELRGGIRTYASRRYVKKIKEMLEL